LLLKEISTYKPIKDETLKTIATDNGVTWQQIALISLGTEDPKEVYDTLRHYLKIDPKNEKPVCLGADFEFEGDEAGEDLKIPKVWSQDGFQHETRHSIRARVIEPRPYIRITRIDDHFAPQHEKLDFSFRIGHLENKKVSLKIKSEHYGVDDIYTRELLAAEKKTGSDKEVTEEYKGETTVETGLLAGEKLYLNPLYSPYKLIIEEEGGISDEIEFKVLYAEIELEQAKWSVDDKEPDKASDLTGWLRWQLNELGYFGGPFTSNAILAGEYLNRAIKMYKASDTEFQKIQYNDKALTTQIGGYPDNDSIYDDLDEDPAQFRNLLEKRLRKSKNKRKFIKLESDPFSAEGDKGTFWVQQVLTQKDSQFFAVESGTKLTQDAARLNCPIQPIRAKIKVKDKTDVAQEIPGAVGQVSVGWRVEDPAETGMNNRYQALAVSANDNQRLPYIQAVQNFITTEAFEYSDGTAMVKNCPECCTGKQNLEELFYDHAKSDGTSPHPMAVRNGLPCTLAGIDPDITKSFGTSSINFLPSNKAGDSFRVIADLDFDATALGFTADHIKELKQDNDANAPGVVAPLKEGRDSCKVKTGIFTIRRTIDFVRIVKWPPDDAYEGEMPRLKLNFEQCYIDMETPGNDEKVSVKKVMSNKEYQKLVRDNFAPSVVDIKAGAGITDDQTNAFVDAVLPGKKKLFWRKFNLKENYLYGRDLPPQGDLTGDEYKAAINSLLYGDSGFVGAMAEKTSYFVATKIRPKVATGHISIAFKSHKPVTVIDDPSLAKPAQVKEQDYVCSNFSSMGNADGVVFYDLGDIDRHAYVTAHEFGHHQFLYHHFVDATDDETLHDTNDDNCIMSYTGAATRVEGVFDPLFCGKCNLRLRGWNVSAPHINFPAGS